MSSAPPEGYHRIRSPRGSGDHRSIALALLEATGDSELPDVRVTAADRRFVKRVLAILELRLSYEVLFHLACGAEAAARRKRAREGRRAS